MRGTFILEAPGAAAESVVCCSNEISCCSAGQRTDRMCISAGNGFIELTFTRFDLRTCDHLMKAFRHEALSPGFITVLTCRPWLRRRRAEGPLPLPYL